MRVCKVCGREEAQARRLEYGRHAPADLCWRQYGEIESCAEERGRRAGIEEAVRIARAAWHEHIEIDRGQIPASAIMDALDRHLAALAPRDSGKVCKCSGAADAKFYDGGHLPDCPVVAPPRDRK